MENKVIFTDVINAYTIPHNDETLPQFDGFNFIIDVSDSITFDLFSKHFKNINKIDSQLIKVYVNPKEIYNDKPCLYIKPLPANKQLKQSIDSVHIFEFPFNKLDTISSPKVTNRMLDLKTMDLIQNDGKVWTMNPLLSKEQNVEIIMQKLIAASITIDTNTYNELFNELQNFNNFKIFNIKHQQLRTFNCDYTNNSYTITGYNLTEWPQ